MPRRAAFFLLLPLFLVLLPATSRATACFSNVSAPLTGFESCSLAWGDYDNDGDLDLLVAGYVQSPDGEPVTLIYRNDVGTFIDMGVGIPGFQNGSVAWGDYDNDGDLDVLISGIKCSTAVTRVYRNSGGPNPTFKNAYANLLGLYDGSVAWGDYDNDGDLDIAVSGQSSSTAHTYIFRSSGGANPTFTNANAALTGLQWGSVSWVDVDNDGDLDLFVTGYSSAFGVGDRAILYINNGGANPTFTGGSGPPTAGIYSGVDWGDYDNDGDLDAVAAGGQSFAVGADIYYQDFGFFDYTFTGLTGVGWGSARWGDYNNDGKLDVLLVGGDTDGHGLSRIYQAPAFTDIGAGLAGVGGTTGNTIQSCAAWGDYDHDGDLDLALAGASTTTPYNIARVYRNDCGTTNTPPTAPTNLQATVNGNTITFSWSPATDAQTPAAGLTYNLRVGTVPGGSNVISPGANPSTGFRGLPAMGNTNLKTSWTLRVPGAGSYYWSVQAIDGSYAGGPFAAEHGIGVTAVEETLTQGALLRVEGPNPLSSAVRISFNVPKGERVEIGIYDVAGRLVRTLMDAEQPAGLGIKIWDGKDEAGLEVTSGMYVVRLHTPTVEATNKVVVVR